MIILADHEGEKRLVYHDHVNGWKSKNINRLYDQQSTSSFYLTSYVTGVWKHPKLTNTSVFLIKPPCKIDWERFFPHMVEKSVNESAKETFPKRSGCDWAAVLNGLGMSADWDQNRGTLIIRSHNQLLCSSSPHDRPSPPPSALNLPVLFQMKCRPDQCMSFFSTTESVLCHIRCSLSFRLLGKPIQGWSAVVQLIHTSIPPTILGENLWFQFTEIITPKL